MNKQTVQPEELNESLTDVKLELAAFNSTSNTKQLYALAILLTRKVSYSFWLNGIKVYTSENIIEAATHYNSYKMARYTPPPSTNF